MSLRLKDIQAKSSLDSNNLDKHNKRISEMGDYAEKIHKIQRLRDPLNEDSIRVDIFSSPYKKKKKEIVALNEAEEEASQINGSETSITYKKHFWGRGKKFPLLCSKRFFCPDIGVIKTFAKMKEVYAAALDEKLEPIRVTEVKEANTVEPDKVPDLMESSMDDTDIEMDIVEHALSMTAQEWYAKQLDIHAMLCQWPGKLNMNLVSQVYKQLAPEHQEWMRQEAFKFRIIMAE
jgi:hypothetical protein